MKPIKARYSIREIRQLFGLSERTVRRWTEAGIIHGAPATGGDFEYDFKELLQFQLVRQMRAKGLTIKQIESELAGQMSLFAADARVAAKVLFLEDGRNGSWEHAIIDLRNFVAHADVHTEDPAIPDRLPFNAEYVLYLVLRRDERELVIGDLMEDYVRLLKQFGKRRADIWLYKQIVGSVLPLLRRTVLKVGALVWLGRILRRLIS